MSTLENLTRLASKPGVQSTLVLSRSDGSIIRSSGLLASSANTTSSEAPIVEDSLTQRGDVQATTNVNNEISLKQHSGVEDGNKSAEHIAKKVFVFLSAANEFADGMERGDDTKLLRIRTRKNEIVIVPGQSALAFQRQALLINPRYKLSIVLYQVMLMNPLDAKFVLVVVHDAPQA